MLSTVHPSPSYHRSPSCDVFEDDAVEALPTVNITRTLAGKLCGRLDDAAFNAKVIELTYRSEVVAHIAAAITSGAGFMLYIVSDIPTRAVMTSVNVVTGLFFFVHTCASLSWDMLRLVLKGFEFWFLFSMNTLNTTLWCLLFHDWRVTAFATIGLLFAMTLTVDANIYSRHLAARFFVLAAPALFIVLSLTVANVPPDLHYQTYHFVGVHIDAIDLLANGNVVIAYFTFILVLRSRSLLFTFGPVQAVKCDFYIPVCHLVPLARSRQMAMESSLQAMTMTNLLEATPLRQLKLLRDKQAHGIDVRDILLPSASRFLHRSHLLHRAGFVGICFSLSAFFWYIASDHKAVDMRIFSLGALGFLLSFSLVLFHAANFQRKLFRRVFREIDAWFVSFQASAVCIGSCDLLGWNPGESTLVLTVWMWCHWTLFLDALPHATRQRIQFSRPLLLVVLVLLAAYPLLLAMYLHVSVRRLHNRVLLNVDVGSMNIHADMLGFIASKMFMLWVWMLRALWREIMWPTDAFKLLERKAFYRVHITK